MHGFRGCARVNRFPQPLKSCRALPCYPLYRSSPAHAHGNWAQVGGDSTAFAVEIAELGVDLHIRAYLAGDAAAEVFAELVQAGVEKPSTQRQVVVRAP